MALRCVYQLLSCKLACLEETPNFATPLAVGGSLSTATALVENYLNAGLVVMMLPMGHIKLINRSAVKFCTRKRFGGFKNLFLDI